MFVSADVDTRPVGPRDVPDLARLFESEDHAPLLVHGILRDSQPVRRWLAQWWQPAAVRSDGCR